MLTDDQRQYFDDIEFMLGTKGWKHLMDEAKVQIYQLQADALEKTRSYEEVCYLRGQAEQIARLLNLADTTANLRTQAEAEDD